MIDTGDTVLHRPTGGTWLVAFVEGTRLAWCGWPFGYAKINDCELVQKTSEAERDALLRKLATMSDTSDPRRRYARRRLGLPAVGSMIETIEWIACAERLPAGGETIIVCADDVSVGRYSETNDTWWIEPLTGPISGIVTHWAPLPKGPK